MFHWYSMPNFSQKYPVVLEKLIFLFFLFLVTAAIYYIIFDLTQFYNSETLESGYAPCEIWEL